MIAMARGLKTKARFRNYTVLDFLAKGSQWVSELLGQFLENDIQGSIVHHEVTNLLRATMFQQNSWRSTMI